MIALSARNGFMRWPTSSRSSPESLAVCSAFSRSQACYMAVEMDVLFSIRHVVLSFSSLVSCCFYEDSAKIRFSEEHCNSRQLYLTSFIKTSHTTRKGMRWLPSCWAVSRLFALSGGGSAVCSRLVCLTIAAPVVRHGRYKSAVGLCNVGDFCRQSAWVCAVN